MIPPIGNSNRCSAIHIRLFAAVGLLSLSLSGCVVVAHRVEVRPVDHMQEVIIRTPVKVHLTDGSTGLYAEGASAVNGTLRGKGYFYDISLKPFPTNPFLTPMPFSSIAAAETYRERVNKGATAAYLPLSILGSVVAVGTGVGGSVEAGTVLDKFPVAKRPEGGIVLIKTNKSEQSGELLAVRDDGIIVAHPYFPGMREIDRSLSQKVQLYPYSSIVALQITARRSIIKRRVPTPDVLEQLRLISRFPQGLSPELMNKLLKAHGQTELVSTAE
jgi:hypothetical protein